MHPRSHSGMSGISHGAGSRGQSGRRGGMGARSNTRTPELASLLQQIDQEASMRQGDIRRWAKALEEIGISPDEAVILVAEVLGDYQPPPRVRYRARGRGGGPSSAHHHHHHHSPMLTDPIGESLHFTTGHGPDGGATKGGFDGALGGHDPQDIMSGMEMGGGRPYFSCDGLPRSLDEYEGYYGEDRGEDGIHSGPIRGGYGMGGRPHAHGYGHGGFIGRPGGRGFRDPYDDW